MVCLTAHPRDLFGEPGSAGMIDLYFRPTVNCQEISIFLKTLLCRRRSEPQDEGTGRRSWRRRRAYSCPSW